MTAVKGPIILGMDISRELKLVTLNFGLQTKPSDNRPLCEEATARSKVLHDHKDCFTGIGCFEGEYEIVVDPTVPPVVHSARRVPIALQDALKEELTKLEQQDIIAKVDQPTNWVNSIVCTTKSNGSLHLV